MGDDPLDDAMGRLSKEYAAQGKASMFETLKPFIDPINSQAALSYEQVADTLQVSLGSVKKLIFRLRKRYAAILREEVARTVATRLRSMRKSMLFAKP